MARRPTLPAAPTATASLYVRLSREADGANLSRDGMLEDVRALAGTLGLTVVSEHVDDGISGAVRNRPEFVAWLDDARLGRASTLIAWHVDRMTREGVNVAALILDAIEGKDPETGAVVRAPARLLDTKGLDSAGDDSAFRFRFVIAAEVARGERERMRDRARSSQRRLRTAGRWPGGVPPYGFRVVDNPDGAGRVLEVEPAEAALIREAASRVLAGQTLAAACRWANGSEGLPPRRTRAWSRVTLRQVLTGAPVSGPILTLDESAAVRQRLTPTPTPHNGVRPGARMLSGILQCHSCGTFLRVGYRNGGYPVYRCPDRQGGGVCAIPVAIAAGAVEAYFEARHLERFGDLPAYTRQASVVGAAAVEAAQVAVDDALAALSSEPTTDHLVDLQEAKRALQEAEEVPIETEVRLIPTGHTVAQEWAASPDARDRRDLIAATVSYVIVRPVGRQGGGKLRSDRLAIVDRPTFHPTASDPATYRQGLIVNP